MPWRDTRDSYAIWISEVMLQQTQVVTVIPYFERFLQRFPSLAHLAHADEQTVLRLWEGLGYYRRARDLWRSARQLVRDNHATIPDDPAYLGTLPGFGRYTTNAVLSQAYDRSLPILEANSARVLCRLFALAENPKEAATRNQLWRLAESLVPTRLAGAFNQAMMELGALVCTPTGPNCSACPLSRHCLAHLQDRQHEIPMRVKSPRIIAIEKVAVVVRKRGKLLIVQRPDQGRWAKMWEFPHHALEDGESTKAAGLRLLQGLGIEGDVADEFAAIRHSVTRFRITMTCLDVAHRRGVVRAGLHANAAWVRPADLHAYPLSAPQRRLAKRVLAEGW